MYEEFFENIQETLFALRSARAKSLKANQGLALRPYRDFKNQKNIFLDAITITDWLVSAWRTLEDFFLGNPMSLECT